MSTGGVLLRTPPVTRQRRSSPMPTYNIDSARTTMIATGKVTPVFEWIEGAPRNAERPVKRDPNTGFPLWVLDCLVDDDAARSLVARGEGPSLDAPVISKLRPVEFEGLSVSVYVNRASSQLVARWSATGIAGNGHKPAAVQS